MRAHSTTMMFRGRGFSRLIGAAFFTLLLTVSAYSQVIINEVDANQTGTDGAEFVELYNTGATSVDLAAGGYVLVLYNGANDQSYRALDLTGTIAAGGFHTIGPSGALGYDQNFAISTDILQNGAGDAVALYSGTSAANFPNGTGPQTANLIDALVYDTANATFDAGLAVLLNNGQAHFSEGSAVGASDVNSMQRCPNGTGGGRNTNTYGALAPTPDAVNTCSAAAGTFLISEFRFSGDTATDEFIELYNNSDSPVDISGYTLQVGATTITIPATPLVPARGHYLLAHGTGYTLSDYGGTGNAAGNLTYGTDSSINAGAILRNASSAILDSVAFTSTGTGFGEGPNIFPVSGTGQYSFVRRFLSSGLPQDTGNNRNDFLFISTTAGTFGRSSLTFGSPDGPSILGAPGPENLTSPIRNTTITPGIVNTGEPAFGTNNNNYNRDPTPGTFPAGTMSIRRTVTNSTGAPVTRIRIHIRDITTLNSPTVVTAPQADLRAVTSSDVPVTGTVTTALGITLETPPTQSLGGGLNSSWDVPIPGGSLAPGATIGVNITLGVNVAGNFRFAVIIEALP